MTRFHHNIFNPFKTKKIRIGFVAICISVVPFLWVYLNQMFIREGFETPCGTILPEIQVREKHLRLDAIDALFSFSVFGDMRWESPPRIAILQQAQMENPLLMVNLGDAVTFSGDREWRRYIRELEIHWNRSIHYFHIPGTHSMIPRVKREAPSFFEHYFGYPEYCVDVASWRFVFLDTSWGYLSFSHLQHLHHLLKEAASQKKRAVLFMHHPPRFKKRVEKHTLSRSSTWLLEQILSGYDVAAIFAAHIHDVFAAFCTSSNFLLNFRLYAPYGDLLHDSPPDFFYLNIRCNTFHVNGSENRIGRGVRSALYSFWVFGTNYPPGPGCLGTRADKGPLTPETQHLFPLQHRLLERLHPEPVQEPGGAFFFLSAFLVTGDAGFHEP